VYIARVTFTIEFEKGVAQGATKMSGVFYFELNDLLPGRNQAIKITATSLGET
jgi:hypothetical protein